MANKQISEFTLKTVPEGSDQILLQSSGGTTLRTTLDRVVQGRVGFFDYNDSATATTPITHNGNEGFIKLTNDTLGDFTNTTYKPLGMTSLWSSVNNQFDFSELALGDVVDLRVDISVTTTANNQDVNLQLQLGIGGFTYELQLANASYKTPGVQPITRYMGFYIGDANTQANTAEVQLDTDSSATVVVNGWYAKIVRK